MIKIGGRRLRNRVFKSIRTMLALLVVVCMIAPFFIMISTSLKTFEEVRIWPPTFIPENINWSNYSEVWLGSSNIKTAFFNSIFVSTWAMVITVVLGTIAAYGVSRFDFKGKRVFLFLIIFAQMFSAVTLVAPMYKVMSGLGLLNTHLSLIIPNVAFSLPMCIWLMYGYMEGIPRSLEEAAMIDGCTGLQAVRRVIMPLLMPGVITAGLFAFIVTWNDLLFAQSFITKQELMTLPVALTTYKSIFDTYYHTMMASSVISVIPVFIIFLLIQKYLVKGLSAGAVKG